MAKDQNLKLTYTTTLTMIDQSPNGVEINFIGQNINGTEGCITGVFDDCSVREIAGNFAALLTNRVKKGI